MESSTKPSATPLHAFSSFFHTHLSRIGSDISARFEDAKRNLANAVTYRPVLEQRHVAAPPFASVLHDSWQPKHAFDIALGADYVAKTMAGTAVYTVSNSNNEFVLISDPGSVKSLSLLCFRQEDAEALLAQVRLRQPVLGRGARVVPITLDQVYMLKVEGIAFRFLPDPTQIRNAVELKGADRAKGFDGVPVFQEDIEREISKVSRRGSRISQHIMVGSLEDVLKKMEMNDTNSGWEDLIFIPPGKSYSQHLKEVAA
ncbi:protein TIC 22, chloroplastic [Cinnamomum micranthum f. kanehirae]|uniref:Protein TIC 22, chloroplastic n=1 Tax=Cinnamomum micranthum f. kanehirae TaxID=337451 RepID=A0A3S3QT16_9MAGN|nr:protein TIC 22, chloroplastic [Cinnamomum micranthum f. kanehirae]